MYKEMEAPMKARIDRLFDFQIRMDEEETDEFQTVFQNEIPYHVIMRHRDNGTTKPIISFKMSIGYETINIEGLKFVSEKQALGIRYLKHYANEAVNRLIAWAVLHKRKKLFIGFKNDAAVLDALLNANFKIRSGKNFEKDRLVAMFTDVIIAEAQA